MRQCRYFAGEILEQVRELPGVVLHVRICRQPDEAWEQAWENSRD